MKITAYLHSTPPFRIVGGERMTLALLEHARDAGHAVTMVVQSFTEASDYHGIPVIPLTNKPAARNALNNAKVIVTHPELAKNLNLNNMVGIVHNLNPGTLAQIKRNKWLAVVANSKTTAKNLSVLNTQYTHVIKPPVIEPKTISLPNRSFVLMSNMSKEKGAHIFFNAAKELGHIPFLGVAGGYNQQYAPELDNLLIMGHGPLDLAFSNAKIIVSPSQSETYGMTIVEAACAGVPAIVSDIPAHREVLGNAATYVPLDAHQSAWINAIRDYMLDKAFYETMLERTLVRKKYLLNQSEKSYKDWLTLLSML